MCMAAGCGVKPPGSSFRGELPPLPGAEARLAEDLRADVEHLAGEIGPRASLLVTEAKENAYSFEFNPANLHAAERYLERRMTSMGYDVRRIEYDDPHRPEVGYANLEVTVPGGPRADEIVVVGAHYDTVPTSPGADDNASGVAATLALAERWRTRAPDRTLRFVLFVNEAKLYDYDEVGSYVYASHARANDDNIVAMLSLEMLGSYSDEPGSQEYPFPFGLLYPSTGNFISFVGRASERELVFDVVRAFRASVDFPSEGAAAPDSLDDAARSDHASFWKAGYPGLMVTDTANFRYEHYHQPTDTPDKLDYERMARLVEGIEAVLRGLAAR